MIAKLIVWGEDRELARRRLVRGARARCEIVGLANNVAFLRRSPAIRPSPPARSIPA